VKVFISHSIKGDPDGEAVAQNLFHALENSRFFPFLDLKSLEVGDQWEKALERQIDESDAAILLLSRRAIERSKWVAREIHLLQVRASRLPGFVMIPLLLGDVRAAELADGRLSHLKVEATQSLRVADVPDWVARVTGRLEKSRDGVLEQYLGALRAQCARPWHRPFSGDQVAPERPPIYIPHVVRQQQADNASGSATRGSADLNIDQLLNDRRDLFIEGRAGTGKSMLLRRVALAAMDRWASGSGAEYLPVLVSARTFARRTGSFAAILHEEVEQNLGRLLVAALPPVFFDAPPVNRIRWLVLIDALDEVPDQTEADRLVSDLDYLSQRGDCPYRFVLTTRPGSGRNRRNQSRFGLATIAPFTRSQVEAFAREWFAGKGNDVIDGFLRQVTGSRIGELTSEPLLLTIAAALHERSRFVGTSRTALYSEFVAALLDDGDALRKLRTSVVERWEREAGTRGRESGERLVDGRHDLLRHLSAYKHHGGAEALGVEAVRMARQRGWLSAEPDQNELARMESLLDATGLIAGGDSGGQAFIHETFVEYFKAAEIIADEKPDGRHRRRFIQQWEQDGEVVLFALGQMSLNGEDVRPWLRTIFKSNPVGAVFCGFAIADGITVDASFESEVVATLLSQLRQWKYSDKFIHPNAADGLAWLTGRPAVRDGLLTLARGTAMRKEEKAITAEILANLGYVDDLTSLSSDQSVDEEVRIKAAICLARWNFHGALQLLVGFVFNPEFDGYVRLEAVEAIANLGQTALAQGLAIYLSLDAAFCDNEYLRVRAASQLGSLGRPEEALELLFRMVHDPAIISHDARRDVVPGMAYLGGTRRLLDMRQQTSWAREITESMLRWQFRYKRDDEGVELLRELLDGAKAAGRPQPLPHAIFRYVQDLASLERIGVDARIDDQFRSAAGRYTQSIKPSEQRDDSTEYLHIDWDLKDFGVRRRAWPAARIAVATTSQALMKAACFSGWTIVVPCGRFLLRYFKGRYAQFNARVASATTAPLTLRYRAWEELRLSKSGELIVRAARAMIAADELPATVRASLAQYLFFRDPAAADWMLIATLQHDWKSSWERCFFDGLQSAGLGAIGVLIRQVATSGDDVGPPFMSGVASLIEVWPDSSLRDALAADQSLKPWVRVAAIRHTPASKHAELLPVACDENTDHWVRIEAVDVLGKAAHKEALERIAFDSNVNDRVRGYAMWWIGRTGEPAMQPRLNDIVVNPEAPLTVRWAASHAWWILQARQAGQSAAAQA
jgi:hypothetical protein